MEFLLNILNFLPNLVLASAILASLILLIGLITVVVLCVVVKVWFVAFHRKSSNVVADNDDDGQIRVGFFHPYCDAGGGGERVLWTGVRALRQRFPAAKLVVYTGDVEVSIDKPVFEHVDQ